MLANRGKRDLYVQRAPDGMNFISGTALEGTPDGSELVFERLKRLAPGGPTLKASVPGPYTLSGRLLPNAQYPDRYALTEALLPMVRAELEALLKAGCREITVDEPSMSCYAHRENPKKLVDIFNRTVESITGQCRLSTHLCFGNFKGRAVGPRDACWACAGHRVPPGVQVQDRVPGRDGRHRSE